MSSDLCKAWADYRSQLKSTRSGVLGIVFFLILIPVGIQWGVTMFLGNSSLVREGHQFTGGWIWALLRGALFCILVYHPVYFLLKYFWNRLSR